MAGLYKANAGCQALGTSGLHPGVIRGGISSMIRQGLPFVIAVASSGLLSLMVLFNGQWAAKGTALLSSWMAHGTGTLAALFFIGVLWGAGRRMDAGRAGPPKWAYLGGCRVR